MVQRLNDIYIGIDVDKKKFDYCIIYKYTILI